MVPASAERSESAGGCVGPKPRLPGPVCHEPQTRRHNEHICRFRHSFVVDPGFVVDPVHSRPPDQPQEPDQPQ